MGLQGFRVSLKSFRPVSAIPPRPFFHKASFSQQVLCPEDSEHTTTFDGSPCPTCAQVCSWTDCWFLDTS